MGLSSLVVACLLFNIVKTDKFQSTLGHIKPKTSDITQANAALNVIKRIIPDRASDFNATIDRSLGLNGRDAFHIEKTSNGIIHITGTSGVAVTWGFHHYIKYFCDAHISWESKQLNLPNPLPDVKIKITSKDRFRYYQNVCTTSYSFVWWSWNDWEKHIDWMALNAINLALAFNGQEAIWRKVYRKLNLTDDEIHEHFGGPAFLSWSRMGNIRGWGGPLSNTWHQRSLLLQKQILQRMRDLGIVPVLPAFAGHVPKAFKRLFPNAKMTKVEPWNNFEDKYCCPYLLEPSDLLFKKVGNMFLNEQNNEFGTDHVYNCDTFNEMTPSEDDLDYLRKLSSSIYSAMTDVDPKAIWMMQNWLFVHELFFWTKERAKALLTSVPKGRMIILDLQSEQFPQYSRLDSYFGQPFIWCMLHNFGGTLGMFGSAARVNTEVFEGRIFPNSTMIGTGLTPEGINQNYVMYDLMTEMSWRMKSTNLTQWFSQYATRRYGREDANATKAWHILKDTVYNYDSIQKMRGKYVISRSPRLNLNPWFWYNTTEFMSAWDHLLQASDILGTNDGYKHDVVDVTRQALQIFGDIYYDDLIKTFKKKQVEEFQLVKILFNQLFTDLDLILSSNEAFLLGRWLQSAKMTAVTAEEERMYELNARNQITLWGPRGEIKDYANKQWGGMVSHFFGPRWDLFMSAMNESLVYRQPFNESCVTGHVFNGIELPFTFDRGVFPAHATGDSIQIAKDIYKRWKHAIKTHVKRSKRRGGGRQQKSSESTSNLDIITTEAQVIEV